jgi:type III secretion protein K
MPDLSLCGRSMAVFNFLPSRTLHPSRFHAYGSAPYAAATASLPALSGIWHRHWSRQILQQENLLDTPVTDIAAAGLAVAVLQPAELAALARRMGAVLCAPSLRYAITGAAVRALQEALGVDVLRLARNGRSLHPGLPGAAFADAGEAQRVVDRTGYAALHAAFDSAKPEVARRFYLKLPAEIGNQPLAIDSASAMALAMSLATDPAAGGSDGVPD